MTHWRRRLIQIALLIAAALAVPVAADTATLECDPLSCYNQCWLNQYVCTVINQGTITDDCTGLCIGDDCDGELDCLLPG